jgi:uncharacterized protein (TIGR02266 family)
MGTAASPAAKSVLVADDTAFVRDRFREAIEAAGHRAVTADSAPRLLDEVRANQSGFDLIVLDLRLPQGRGVPLLRAVRNVDTRSRILVFSGTIASADEVRQLQTLGVAGYLNEYTASQHIAASLEPHLFPESANRRGSPRVVVGIPVSYRYGNTIAAALTLTLSRGGVAIRTTSPLAVGTSARVRFRPPGASGEIAAQARVAWTDRRMGMGLAFTDIDPDAQARIDQFVSTHFFRNRKA